MATFVYVPIAEQIWSVARNVWYALWVQTNFKKIIKLTVFEMQCYNIVITLQLTISHVAVCSVSWISTPNPRYGGLTWNFWTFFAWSRLPGHMYVMTWYGQCFISPLISTLLLRRGIRNRWPLLLWPLFSIWLAHVHVITLWSSMEWTS